MVSFFNYKITESLRDIKVTQQMGDNTDLHTAAVVSCLNPHSFVEAQTDDAYRKALEESDHLLPDGEGICLVLKLWGRRKVRKIAGDDLHNYLLDRLSECGGRAYYMGSSEKVLNLIEARLHRECPSIAVKCWSPSYCEELSEEESNTIISDINAFHPDVLFVSMTAPKQEKWVAKHKAQLTTPTVIASIGAAFDFYSGTTRRAPAWVVRIKLEWLVRLLKEPRRMLSRNLVSTPKFLFWTWRNRRQLRIDN